MFLKSVPNFQSSYKYGNEIFFVFLFVSVITINKYVLSELKFTVPTVFQGWQTFSCVILLSILIKFKKITSNLQILDAKVLALLVPALVCFTLGIVAGSIALASLPVPIFLAVTNLYESILILFFKKKEAINASIKICGSTAVLGLTLIILICHTSSTVSATFWLLGHIFLNLVYYLYLSKLNLDLTNTTQIYYRNFFSVILLFPVSIYLDVLHLPGGSSWEFYVGCFLSGLLGTLLQIWTYKVSKKPNYLHFEGLAKVICSIIAYKVFFTNIEPFIWVLIIFNFLICSIFTNEQEKIVDVKSNINLSIPLSFSQAKEADRVLLV